MQQEMTQTANNTLETKEKYPLYYTFGNHMHWVDMQWLWGYHVLPNSVRDMIHFCNETGAKGNINFEGAGYEKMASEAPEALNELREAIAQGQIEVVGASYGQPYGLFHGSESNVRQRTYGVRSVIRLLGVRPRTFWEEEFDFFPQLPQLLRGVGYEYASLFFQWTWHTPIIPEEELPAIWWEGQDGSRLLTATRNKLNLHQWPEDFAGLLESDVPKEMPAAGIVQWLELMPSPDWMCRSELLLPQLKQLMQHPDYELRFATLSEYLEVARPFAESRQYTMDDAFHGMSLGKNGDLYRRLSRNAEQTLLAAESISSMMGLFGRPYPHWDVYPTWELEEAWRELLAAQHHDNDECEGLCGHVGKFSYDRSLSLSEHVIERSLDLLANRIAGDGEKVLAYNPLGWNRDAVIDDPQSGTKRIIHLPPFGYQLVTNETSKTVPQVSIGQTDTIIKLQRGAMQVDIDKQQGLIRQIFTSEFPEGVLAQPLGQLAMTRNQKLDTFPSADVSVVGDTVHITRRGEENASLTLEIKLAEHLDALDIHYTAENLPRPDALMHASLQTSYEIALPGHRMLHDHPYGVSEIKAEGTYLRKYPSGEWMTSPQYFEEVHNPFTALQLLDFTDDERGLLLLHDGSQAFFRDGAGVRQILSMYDAWDEDYFVDSLSANVRLIPHGTMSHAQRWKLAQEFTRPALMGQGKAGGGNLPAQFGSIYCDAPNVALTAFFRETEESGRELNDYAGTGLEFPYILRLVEFDGTETKTMLRLPGTVARASQTNLLGETIKTLEITNAEAPAGSEIEWSQITVTLRPYEIATVYLDLEYGRKIPRNLDEHRSIWATIHRINESKQENDLD